MEHTLPSRFQVCRPRYSVLNESEQDGVLHYTDMLVHGGCEQDGVLHHTDTPVHGGCERDGVLGRGGLWVSAVLP